MAERILNSWKEIAQYVGRGVRTLQRWERELGFPVRRPRPHQRSAVIAFPAEVDAWLKATQTRRAKNPDVAELYQQFFRNAEVFVTRTRTFTQQRSVLRQYIDNTILLSKKLQANRSSRKNTAAAKKTTTG